MGDAVIEFTVDYLPLVLIVALVGGGWMQLRALKRYRGGWRIAACVPLVTLGAALAVAVVGSLAGSNLAPIWVVFALPPCFVWMLVLTAAHRAWDWAGQEEQA